MKTPLLLLALLPLALPAAAQRRTEPLLSARMEWSARDTVPGPRGSTETRLATRTLTAAGGMALGFFGGAVLGVAVNAARGDDSFLPVIIGAGGGAMIMGGIGAGVLDFQGDCPRSERILRGALGGTVSTLAALVVLSHIRNEVVDGAMIVAVPLGAAVAADC